jgi:hypothetical protein
MRTAVEWFANRISHGGLVSKKQFNELLEQAKEMDKEQMIEFASNCIHRNSCFFNIEEYYETFKQQEQ